MFEGIWIENESPDDPCRDICLEYGDGLEYWVFFTYYGEAQVGVYQVNCPYCDVACSWVVYPE